jgi:periplasmic protein TonB
VTRAFAALSLGIAVTFILFWMMQFMVMNNQHRLQATDDLKMVEFIRLKQETKPKIKDRKIPEKPKPQKRPPPPKMEMQQAQITQKNVPNVQMPNLHIPLQSGRFNSPILSGVGMGRGKISTNVIPLVRVPPRYPMRAARRRIEGWVKVEFTITETGTVKDAVVVAAQPDDIFNHAALQSIAKWKFKPKVIDGEAFEQRAIQVLQFKLKK